MTPPPFELPPPHAPQSADGQGAGKATDALAEGGALAELTPAMAREIELWPIGRLEPYRKNARTHSAEQVQQIAASILEFGFLNPVLVSHGTIRAGHGRTLAAEALGMTEVPVVVLDHLTEDQARAFTIADNRLAELAGWDEEALATELAELAAGGVNLAVTGFSAEELEALAASLENPSLEPAVGAPEDIQKMSTTTANGVLALRFGVPPLSVLDMRKGYWQQRKAAWLALGIRSHDGRPANLLKASSALKGSKASEGKHLAAMESAAAIAKPGKTTGRYDGGNAFGFGSVTGGTSAFDPVLCELAYRWWCPEGGSILDPFAGGSVRGIVAAKLGFSYCGLELRQEQVDANCAQAAAVLGDGWDLKVQWLCADSAGLAEQLADSEPFDFLFTCPPYYDLERYGDDPRDLSNAPTYGEFLERYRAILAAAVEQLAPDRYACIVVSDIRDKEGLYRGFERDTQLAMEAAGAPTYNLAVLLEPIGPTAIRAGRIFNGGRKLSKVHQAVQVFAKGKPWSELSPLLGPTSWAELDSDGALEAELAEESAAEPAAPREHLPAVSVLEKTPLELLGGVTVKRDDLCRVAGVSGGKVRSCWILSQGAAGLVTAGSRRSPQGVIVASIAKELGIPCRIHMPDAPAQPDTAEMLGVLEAGGEIVRIPQGRNNVIIASARRDAAERGWADIPFGMECAEAVQETALQVAGMREVLEAADRIVMPVGSGMSLAGVLTGLLAELEDPPKVLGIVVGAKPDKRLDKYAPENWRELVELCPAGSDYHKPAETVEWHGLRLDSGYEAKCIPFLQPGDLFWVVGIRQSEDPLA